jgi:dipeptide/tripeptide permease
VHTLLVSLSVILLLGSGLVPEGLHAGGARAHGGPHRPHLLDGRVLVAVRAGVGIDDACSPTAWWTGTVLGVELNASQFGAFNSLFIMLLAPVFAWLWIMLAARGLEPSTPVKFGLGIMQAGLGFGALVFGSQFPDATGHVALLWLVLAYLLHTTGELCLSPVGLSAVTKLSVPRVVGLMMGAWFLATAYSENLAAQISKIAAIESAPGESVAIATQLATYTELFGLLFWIGLGVGAVMIVISPLLRRGMHGSTDPADGSAISGSP